MSPIEKRLIASINVDAINGDRSERAVCQSQMYEAANEITILRSRIALLDADAANLIKAHNEMHTAAQAYIAALENKWIAAIGWAYADCCTTLDDGGDPRQTEMPDVLRRATIDLKEQGNE